MRVITGVKRNSFSERTHSSSSMCLIASSPMLLLDYPSRLRLPPALSFLTASLRGTPMHVCRLQHAACRSTHGAKQSCILAETSYCPRLRRHGRLWLQRQRRLPRTPAAAAAAAAHSRPPRRLLPTKQPQQLLRVYLHPTLQLLLEIRAPLRQFTYRQHSQGNR